MFCKLRKHLLTHGVTSERAMSEHTKFIRDIEDVTGRPVNLSLYAPNPMSPNSLPPMMG